MMKKIRKKNKNLKKLKKSKTGNCYEVNGRYYLNNCHTRPNLRLVHGEVTGQGEINGVRYGHCWLEEDGTVYDYSNGLNLEVPKGLYYMVGQIGANNIVYDKDAFLGHINRTGTWGPWDFKSSTGL